jgi:plasmid stabilization system protein ParE
MVGFLGHKQRVAATKMPRITYSRIALLDLVRLHKFLQLKDEETAKRAVQEIRKAIKSLKVHPDRFRPVLDKIHHREIVIDFGSSGYITRFYKKSDEEIIIIAIKHQLENDFFEHEQKKS